jgi:hypothetical protein
MLHVMKQLTRRLWEEQDRHPGDRLRLFESVADFIGNTPVLYPGSFVDIAASFVFDSVTYVDNDRRAARFFADPTGVDEIISRHRIQPTGANWRFIGSDYRTELDLADQSVGLLVSLYAGFVSEHCTRYLLPGGWLLVNPSHGDAAMASIDPRYRFAAAVNSRSGRYTITERDLDGYLIPKRPATVTAELLRETGRGIAYTRSPFAYLFQLKND